MFYFYCNRNQNKGQSQQVFINDCISTYWWMYIFLLYASFHISYSYKSVFWYPWDSSLNLAKLPTFICNASQTFLQLVFIWINYVWLLQYRVSARTSTLYNNFSQFIKQISFDNFITFTLFFAFIKLSIIFFSQWLKMPM